MVEWWWLVVVCWLSVAATLTVVVFTNGAVSRRDWRYLVATLLWPLFILGWMSSL